MTAAVLAPVRALAAAVKPVTIRDVDIFPIEIPVSPAEHDAGFDHRFTVVKVETDAGVRGYSFAGPPTAGPSRGPQGPGRSGPVRDRATPANTA